MKRHLTLSFTLITTLLVALFYTLSKCLCGIYFTGWTNVLLWCSLGISLLLSILLGYTKKEEAEKLSYITSWPKIVPISSALGGVIFFFFGTLHFINGLVMSANAKSPTLFPLAYILMGFLFVLGGVYLCLSPLPNATTQARDAIFGMAIPIGCILRVLMLYFEATTPKNASEKLFISLVYLILALYWISDVRLTIGRTVISYHRIISPITAILCGGVAVGTCAAALITRTSLAFGAADPIFFAVSFLLINIKGYYTFENQEIEALDIE